MSRFRVGQSVQSLVSAQGLLEGERLEVTVVDVTHTPFGGFTALFLRRPTGEVVGPVRNPHLVLTPA